VVKALKQAKNNIKPITITGLAGNYNGDPSDDLAGESEAERGKSLRARGSPIK